MSSHRELIESIESLDIIGAETGDETFTHTHLGTFNVTKIRRYLAGRPSVRLDIMNNAMLRDREIDEHRVEEIMYMDFPPIILIDCEDGTHLLIDGTHRVVARRLRGFDWAEARIATLSEVQPFMVQLIAKRADGSVIDQRELDRAFLANDVGRHNAPDGKPRPGSTKDWVLPPRRND